MGSSKVEKHKIIRALLDESQFQLDEAARRLDEEEAAWRDNQKVVLLARAGTHVAMGDAFKSLARRILHDEAGE